APLGLTKDGHPINAFHDQVSDDHIQIVCVKRRQCLLAARSHDDVPPFSLQVLTQNSDHLRVVVHEEYPRRHITSTLTSGTQTVNVDPEPRVLSTQISPPCVRTMSRQIARPRPVPCPRGLVVRNGSKIRGSNWSTMPLPVSVTTSAMPLRSSRTIACAEIVTRPPGPVASSAFRTRLITTCCICGGS